MLRGTTGTLRMLMVLLSRTCIALVLARLQARYMLLGAALVPNDLDRAVAERGKDGLRVHGSLRLLLAVGLLVLGGLILVAEPDVLRAAPLALVDGLLRAAVADHQRIVVAQQLVIIYCSVGRPHIGAAVMLAPLLLLVLICDR